MSRESIDLFGAYMSKEEIEAFRKKHPNSKVFQKEVEISCHCDVCKKEIKLGETYLDITTGHHDWGNDSVESIKHHDCCSFDCAKHYIDEYEKLINSGKSTTAYVEIQVDRLSF